LAAVAEAMDAEAHDGHGPTYFELTAALALLHFRREGADWAVLEVGMGGRLDCTNVCLPRVSVITSISFDHTKQLGNTLALIAREKAGIIKPGVPVVSGVTAAEPRDVIREVAAKCGSPLRELGRDFKFAQMLAADPLTPGTLDFWDATGDTLRDVRLGLPGSHQGANAAVALATLAELRGQGWALPESGVRAGLSAARSAARIEVLGRRPWVILDVAHNVASARALAECLGRVEVAGERHLVLGVARDKDVAGLLRELAPVFDRLIATRFVSNPRGLESQALAELARSAGFVHVETAAEPAAAWLRVRELAGADDLVCVAGSFFLAGEMRPLLVRQPLRA
jgi:dihydrofolate synthase/folylpolyglutamate synthase